MSPSPESRALEHPLQVVAQLYGHHQAQTTSGRMTQDSDTFFHDVTSHFSSLLAGHSHAIPSLADVNERGKLVRFRCMVQDTGLANEVYAIDDASQSEQGDDDDEHMEDDHPTRQSSRRSGRGCCAYSEGAASGSPIIGYDNTDYTKLRERQVVYATSVPGQTEWYTRQLASSSSNSTGAFTPASLAGDLAARMQISREQVPSGSGSSRNNIAARAPPPPLSNKFPLPNTPHTGALLKIYPQPVEADTQLKATEIVDLVGVLDYSYFPSASLAAFDSSNVPVSSSVAGPTAEDQHQQALVKTLHVLYRLPLSPPGDASAPSTPAASTTTTKAAPEASTSASSSSSSAVPPLDERQWKEARASLIDHLAARLGGDRLAGELLLLSLYGHIYARRGPLALGQMPINLNVQAIDNNTAAAAAAGNLCEFLQEIVQQLVKLGLNIDALNSSVYNPESREENLISGQLQLPADTVLFVDETKMVEGTLKDRAVRNVQALTQVINDQTLAYVFPYSSFTFETDLKVVVVSRGKSLLPIECVVPVRQTESTRSSSSESTTPPPSPSEEDLTRWRAMLRWRAAGSFSIPDDVSEYIQSDFVAARQAKTVTQEDLVLRMTMARLMAISHGRSVLDRQTWELTRRLDEERKARL